MESMMTEAMHRLSREYLSKVEVCDECFSECWCIEHETKESRVPHKGCEQNIIAYLSDQPFRAECKAR